MSKQQFYDAIDELTSYVTKLEEECDHLWRRANSLVVGLNATMQREKTLRLLLSQAISAIHDANQLLSVQAQRDAEIDLGAIEQELRDEWIALDKKV